MVMRTFGEVNYNRVENIVRAFDGETLNFTGQDALESLVQKAKRETDKLPNSWKPEGAFKEFLEHYMTPWILESMTGDLKSNEIATRLLRIPGVISFIVDAAIQDDRGNKTKDSLVRIIEAQGKAMRAAILSQPYVIPDLVCDPGLRSRPREGRAESIMAMYRELNEKGKADIMAQPGTVAQMIMRGYGRELLPVLENMEDTDLDEVIYNAPVVVRHLQGTDFGEGISAKEVVNSLLKRVNPETREKVGKWEEAYWKSSEELSDWYEQTFPNP
jgi:hypothetical protein